MIIIMNELFLPIGLNIFNSVNKGKIEFIYEEFNNKIENDLLDHIYQSNTKPSKISSLKQKTYNNKTRKSTN